MSRHGSQFKEVNPAAEYGKKPTENVVVAIDINGTPRDVKIGVWIDQGFVEALKSSAELRAGLVDALEHQINFVCGVI